VRGFAHFCAQRGAPARHTGRAVSLDRQKSAESTNRGSIDEL
jgi:hypothetical protein